MTQSRTGYIKLSWGLKKLVWSWMLQCGSEVDAISLYMTPVTYCWRSSCSKLICEWYVHFLDLCKDKITTIGQKGPKFNVIVQEVNEDDVVAHLVWKLIYRVETHDKISRPFYIIDAISGKYCDIIKMVLVCISLITANCCDVIASYIIERYNYGLMNAPGKKHEKYFYLNKLTKIPATLRIFASYKAKTAKISNLYTSRPII